jgi:molybdate transport system substrate-binding protein
MRMTSRRFKGLGIAIAVILALPASTFAQVRVLTSGGFASALQEVLPKFEKETGIKVTIARGASQGTGSNTIGAQLRRGVPADVVVMAREGLDELVSEGRIARGTDVDLAQTPLGVAVRAGSPKPDLSSLAAFKQALLHAKAVSHTGSTTGIYLTSTAFAQIGIADEMAKKIIVAPITAVTSGESEIALQPVSELVHVPGVDFVGPVPEEIQYISVFSAAVVEGSKEPEGSRRLIAFLSSEKTASAIKESGMEPPKPR